MSGIKRYDRVRLRNGILGVVVGLPEDGRVFFWPDRYPTYVEVDATDVVPVFGPGDTVIADGWERTVVQYTRNQSYRLREHKHGTVCDFYAWEITPAGQEVPA